MAKRKQLLCTYCKGTETFVNDKGFTRWGVRCKLTSGYPIRSHDTEEQAQRSIDEWCTGDGRRACRPYLLHETKHSYNFVGDLLSEFDAMEVATMAKQTYHCACGKTFQKSSSAQDTGYRMDDYDKAHECYGCPFVEPVKDWNTGTDKSHECRASVEKVKYTTTASMALDSDCVARVYTLDLAWLDFFINSYLDTPGCGRSVTNRDPATLEKAFRLTGLNKGRRTYSFEFEKNKQGREARRIVHDEFFDEKGEAYQLGCGPSDPKVRVLQMIEYAKREAREDNDMAKLEVPVPDASTCPYYNGIETTYSPKGYCVDCAMAKGANRSVYDLKSWALDAVHKRCLRAETYSTCYIFKQAEKAVDLSAVQEVAAVVPNDAQRSITDITAEIQIYKAHTVQNYIEIGKRLVEAKTMLEHGQWGIWLKNAVEFSERTARNLMAVAEQYANRQPVADLVGDSNSEPVRNLSYTHLLALLAVPTEEREEFLEATHIVDGQEKTVDEMSKRELQKVIKERDEVKQQLADAQRDAEQQRIMAQMREDMEQAATRKLGDKENELRLLKDENRLQRKDIERLESKPIDVAVQQPSAAELESMRTAIRAEVIKELALPKTYLAKKGVDEATSIFMDSVGGSVANGLVIAMRLDASTAAKMLEVYISTLVQYTQQLRDRLNLMRAVDRSAKEGAGDVDW